MASEKQTTEKEAREKWTQMPLEGWEQAIQLHPSGRILIRAKKTPSKKK